MTRSNLPLRKAASRKRHILVVDEPRTLRLMRVCLEVAGYEVVMATGGEDALELLESKKPDMVLLDIAMPGMDGFDVLRRVRASSDIPVVVCTSSASARDTALALGADDFIVKPFKPEELEEKIGDLLALRKRKYSSVDHSAPDPAHQDVCRGQTRP